MTPISPLDHFGPTLSFWRQNLKRSQGRGYFRSVGSAVETGLKIVMVVFNIDKHKNDFLIATWNFYWPQIKIEVFGIC
jgi:hypothetical protein